MLSPTSQVDEEGADDKATRCVSTENRNKLAERKRRLAIPSTMRFLKEHLEQTVKEETQEEMDEWEKTFRDSFQDSEIDLGIEGNAYLRYNAEPPPPSMDDIHSFVRCVKRLTCRRECKLAC